MDKIVLIIFATLSLISCQKSKNEFEYLHDKGYAVLAIKNKNHLTVFCNPLKISRYSTSFIFDVKLKEDKFSGGYFLNYIYEKKNFDTLPSNEKNNVFIKLKDSLLIIKIKSQNIGGEEVFPNNYLYNYPDTMKLFIAKKNIVGLGYSKQNLFFYEPFFITNSTNKDSLNIKFKTQTSNKFQLNDGIISNKDVFVIK